MPWYRKWAWIVISILAGLLTLFGVFVLFSPVDAADFESETGVAWAEFSTVEPQIADYLEREARILASVTIGLGVLTAGLAAGPLRRGDRTAWLLLWAFILAIALITIVFFVSGAAALGSVYLVVAVVTAIALLLAMPVETN